MGAQLSKGGAAETESAAAKTNGQENGHVKTNGDVSAKPEGEAAVTDGNGTAEAPKETAETGDAIEVADGEGASAKAEDGEAAKEVKKKKKKFSLKNSFKFKGFSLKKSKNGTEEPAEAVAAAPEENGHAPKETKEEEPAAAESTEAAPEATPEAVSEAAPEAAPDVEQAAEPEPKEEPKAEPKAEEPAPVPEATSTEESADEAPAPTPAETEATPAEPTPSSE